MDNSDLQKLVEQISLQYFSLPFNHKAAFNQRLKTTAGRYLIRTHHLEFNLKYYKFYGIEELINVIKHELCHYHLHIQGKGYLHRDKNFKECLEKVKGSRYAKQIHEKKDNPYRYILECSDCKQQYYRKRRMDFINYRCGKCGGKLVLNNINA